MSTEYATKHLKPAERFAFWRDVICDAYLPIHCATPDAAGFDGGIMLDRLTKLNVSRVTGSPQQVTRRKDHIARDAVSFFMLSLQLSDVGHLSQLGRSTVLHPGDFGLYTTSEPYEVTCGRPVNQLVIQIPYETLLARVPQVEMLTGLGVSAASDIGGLVSQQLRQCAAHVSGQSALVQTHMQDMMVDLVAVGIATLAEGKVALGRPDQLLLARAKTVIRDHLREEHLKPTFVADAVGMSQRNLARVFQREGSTIAAFIRQARLEAISQDLIDPRLVSHSVSQIACKWGLHNFQHFSKQFKDAYGMTPREWRVNKRTLQ
ncbi:helix-turn-helix domain-containing protein [Epibacterium ulvae]|uniref:AraC-like ligand-binding domain-containing protein n=1 Tax=Epibacterium ulvae TaxID=1156985 RepID=UPI001BFBF96B|nr:helix-turn-helix domain-containing protein [Epibacterium ulvae]MBT8154681.1 helix-turn-helix domain-containing protein [Epibacterium ulvae]